MGCVNGVLCVWYIPCVDVYSVCVWGVHMVCVYGMLCVSDMYVMCV